MTCPICLPSADELNNLHVHWLTADAPWDPTEISEPLDTQVLVPLGYTSALGTIDLIDLDMDFGDLGEDDPLRALNSDEISKALLYINLCTNRHINLRETKPQEEDYQHYQPFLGWKPLEVIKKTFAATTQWAAVSFSPPLKRHYKSRFPALNKPRLREMFCTDTWFGSTPAMGGFTCAQLYYGVKSKFIALYPMTTESQGPESLEDLCRDRGAPIKLKNDQAQMEIGKTWTAICRKYNIAQCTTEAHMPWQNEAEWYIQDINSA